MRGNLDIASAGGLLKDQNGKWLKDFCIGLGFTSNMIAKLWA